MLTVRIVFMLVIYIYIVSSRFITDTLGCDDHLLVENN